jgi:hypothetical protein
MHMYFSGASVTLTSQVQTSNQYAAINDCRAVQEYEIGVTHNGKNIRLHFVKFGLSVQEVKEDTQS